MTIISLYNNVSSEDKIAGYYTIYPRGAIPIDMIRVSTVGKMLCQNVTHWSSIESPETRASFQLEYDMREDTL